MKTILTILGILAILFISGCFFRMTSEGLKLESGSLDPAINHSNTTNTTE
jgi:hypothetical protein